MPLYIADYRVDTAHLCAAQHGAYLLLIMHYWANGKLPHESDHAMARIACMSPAEWRKHRTVISAFFTEDWKHKRVEEELAKAADISCKRRAAANEKHSKSTSTCHANAEQVDTQSQSPRKKEEKKDAAGAAPDGALVALNGGHAGPDPDTDLFRRGREVLGKNAGGMIAGLKRAKNGSVPLARAALEQASTKNDPREYVMRIVNGRAAELSQKDDPNEGLT